MWKSPTCSLTNQETFYTLTRFTTCSSTCMHNLSMEEEDPHRPSHVPASGAGPPTHSTHVRSMSGRQSSLSELEDTADLDNDYVRRLTDYFLALRLLGRLEIDTSGVTDIEEAKLKLLEYLWAKEKPDVRVKTVRGPPFNLRGGAGFRGWTKIIFLLWSRRYIYLSSRAWSSKLLIPLLLRNGLFRFLKALIYFNSWQLQIIYFTILLP